jgi:hypothetical protein
MWQNRLHPCAVFTETSGGFAPHYLVEIRHDLSQTTRCSLLMSRGLINTIKRVGRQQKSAGSELCLNHRAP